jgi:hypothetical protein
MAAKFFVGLPLDGPDPECVNGHGAHELELLGTSANAGTLQLPRPSMDHSKPVRLTRKPDALSRA